MNRRGNPFLLCAYLSISALLGLSIWLLLLLPQYLAQHHWSSQKIGWAMGAFFLAHLCTQTFGGNLTKRFGNVRTALGGTIIAILGGLFYLGSLRVLDLLIVARVLHGAGTGLILAGVLIHLIESVPAHLKGRMIGYFGLPGLVMLGAGPFISQILQNHWELWATFCVVSLAFVAVALILLMLPRPLVRRRGRRRFFIGMKLNFPRLKPVLFFALLFAFCLSAWQSFLAPAVSQIGMAAVSTFGIGYGTGAVISRLGISPGLEHGRRRLVAISGLVPYGLLLALLPQLDHLWQFTIAGLVCGVIHGVYYPGLSSIAVERFHPLVPGHGMSLYISASSLGLFMGPPVWGTLVDNTNYSWMFAVAGMLLGSTTIAYLAAEWRLKGEGGLFYLRD